MAAALPREVEDHGAHEHQRDAGRGGPAATPGQIIADVEAEGSDPHRQHGGSGGPGQGPLEFTSPAALVPPGGGDHHELRDSW
eukprot:4223620-Pyramimonas_sp.AAC.1